MHCSQYSPFNVSYCNHYDVMSQHLSRVRGPEKLSFIPLCFISHVLICYMLNFPTQFTPLSHLGPGLSTIIMSGLIQNLISNLSLKQVILKEDFDQNNHLASCIKLSVHSYKRPNINVDGVNRLVCFTSQCVLSICNEQVV